MERRSIVSVFGSLPLPQQVMVGAAIGLLAMGAFLFVRWVSQPSYALLYANLDDQTLSAVVDQLDRADIPYQIDGAGSRVLVPRSMVYQARAELASAGVRAQVVPQGYEQLDQQGLNVSQFMQDVNYQRALEGELAKTLMAMEDVASATVHLVLPKDALFSSDQQQPTASVLVRPVRPLGAEEVETITDLVAAAVEGLTVENVTVADVSGTVLHAAGDQAGAAALTSRNLRMTREYETALAGDVESLLGSVLGPGRSSVVVRATLDFDQVSSEQETYDPKSATPLKESVTTESFSGTGTPPSGTVGVNGAPTTSNGSKDSTYDRNETLREYGIDHTVSHRVAAPGVVKSLSAAVLVDDGSLTGASAPDAAEVQKIVSAALGVDASRGDQVAVSLIPFPAPADTSTPAADTTPASSPLDMLPQALGGLVLLLVVGTLLFMLRGANKRVVAPIDMGSANAGLPGRTDRATEDGQPARVVDQGVRPDVIDLVQRQPEEIAVLLRGWLADRR